MTDEAWISKHLAEFFKDEPHKIGLWLLTPNPMFGMVIPAWLILAGRSGKVRKWMENTIQENTPPQKIGETE